MKIALIQPPCSQLDDDQVDPPLGLLYIGTRLQQEDHEVSILDFSGGTSPEIPECDIYGFTALTPSYGWIVALREGLRYSYPEALMVVGGAHVTAIPNSPGWDYVVIGEGEEAMSRIVRDEVPRGIVQGTPVFDLDELDQPDYSLVNVQRYTQHIQDRKALPILSTRGCPYNCAFCNSILYKGNRVRFRSPDNINKELKYIDSLGYTAVKFCDDLFTVNEDWLEKVTAVIKPYNMLYRCHAHANNFTERIAELLADSGCVEIAIGVESGSNKILKLMNKAQTKQKVFNTIQIAKSFNIRTRAYLLVGFPGETQETLEETRDFMLECAPDSYGMYAPIPYPGTDLARFPEKYGITWISPNFNDYMHIARDGRTNYLLSHYTADAIRIREMHQWLGKELASLTWFGTDIGKLGYKEDGSFSNSI